MGFIFSTNVLCTPLQMMFYIVQNAVQIMPHNLQFTVQIILYFMTRIVQIMLYTVQGPPYTD